MKPEELKALFEEKIRVEGGRDIVKDISLPRGPAGGDAAASPAGGATGGAEGAPSPAAALPGDAR
jgi:hypothetical protein